jgi:hypothetical protein
MVVLIGVEGYILLPSLTKNSGSGPSLIAAATASPSPTAVPSDTATPAIAPTDTPAPTPTPTIAPTDTPIPTDTPSPSLTAAPTAPPKPVVTPKPFPTSISASCKLAGLKLTCKWNNYAPGGTILWQLSGTDYLQSTSRTVTWTLSSGAIDSAKLTVTHAGHQYLAGPFGPYIT